MSTRKSDHKVKITKSRVDRVSKPDAGQAFLRDTELKGFAVRITSGGIKTFVVEKRINGKVRRKSLGRYGELTVEQARKLAQKYLGKVASGENPIAEQQRAALEGTTLNQAFEDFVETRKNLKARTLYDYRRIMTVALKDWANKPLNSITKDMVAQRHKQLGETSGEAYANLSMRFLRSLMNFAQAHYEDEAGTALLIENPVNRLTRTRAWYKVKRRQTVIKPHQLRPWYEAVRRLREDQSSLNATTVADYLILLLFTGLRREEAAQLRWDQVDLDDSTLFIPDPKNREPLTLPLSDYAKELLEKRYAARESAFVFPGGGKTGHLVEPRKQIHKVIEWSGIQFSIHDLRRTFITVAESLDISYYALKRLVNHKTTGDVTAGYIVKDLERLRNPMQAITDYLVDQIGLAKGQKVVKLQSRR